MEEKEPKCNRLKITQAYTETWSLERVERSSNTWVIRRSVSKKVYCPTSVTKLALQNALDLKLWQVNTEVLINLLKLS